MKDGTLLLVEDSEDDEIFVRNALRRIEMESSLKWVRDGSLAIEYLTGKGEFADRARFPIPNLILLDLRMPKLDGFEFLNWLRNDVRFRRLPVTVFSASTLQQDLERAYNLGANSYLAKPFNLDELFGAIQTFTGFWFNCCHLPQIKN